MRVAHAAYLIILTLLTVIQCSHTMLTYKMAIIWPRGYCLAYEGKCESKIENLPEKFTIHGLWAIDRTPKPKPQPKTPPAPPLPKPAQFDATLLEDMKEELRTNWPATWYFYIKYVSTEAEDINFWRHEWVHHGKQDPIYKTRLHDYYKHTLEVFAKLDATKIIDQAGKPSTPESLREALKQQKRTVPEFLCTTPKKDKPNYLTEIHFCMDATASTFVDCIPKEKPDQKQCKEGQAFLY